MYRLPGLAQVPIVFLFATKNSLLSLLRLGNGYEKMNHIYRWSGRDLFRLAVIHDSLRTRNHLQCTIPLP